MEDQQQHYCRFFDEASTTQPSHLIDPLQTVPVEIGLHILRFLDDYDLCQASQVSRLWNQLTTSSLELLGRRRRHVAYMRHVWSAQRQNIDGQLVHHRMTRSTWSSNSSHGTSTSGRRTTMSIESCSGASYGTPANDENDDVFAAGRSSLRRPLALRQVCHPLPVTTTSGVFSSMYALNVKRSNSNERSLFTSSAVGTGNVQQSPSFSNGVFATSVSLTAVTADGNESAKPSAARRKAQGYQKRWLRRL